jgi:hypothetical protein
VSGVLPRFADSIFKPGLDPTPSAHRTVPSWPRSTRIACRNIDADGLSARRYDGPRNLLDERRPQGVLGGQKASATFAADAQRLQEAT